MRRDRQRHRADEKQVAATQAECRGSSPPRIHDHALAMQPYSPDQACAIHTAMAHYGAWRKTVDDHHAVIIEAYRSPQQPTHVYSRLIACRGSVSLSQPENIFCSTVPPSQPPEEEEEVVVIITSGNWRGKHNSLSRGAGADQP